MSLMSVNWPQRVTSQFLEAPSISTMNSSTNLSLSRYFSRRCCLQISAVCFCRFLVPNPIIVRRIFVQDPYCRPSCSRLSLAQLNDYIFGSQFAVLYLFHNRSERKAQLRVR